MRRTVRAVHSVRVGLLALAFSGVAIPSRAQPLRVLDVPFIAQSELLCGGAAAAMVMRYWGERSVDAESFQPLVDRRSGGIRTSDLAAGLQGRGWSARVVPGGSDALAAELERGRPVIALLEERPHTYHYVVVVARSQDGVIFHDPARAPFRVATITDFERRWSAADRWMLVVTPPTPREAPSTEPGPVTGVTTCDQQIAEGVRQAQQDDLAAAERTLVPALSCPGDAALRELAGVRVRQRRWADAADLATAALARDPSDQYAWRLLGTARFVSDDAEGALDAWNRVEEPRIDLIRVDGLTRTRYAVVQRTIGLKSGDRLTRASLGRARRRLDELPAGSGRIDFAPLAGGLAEVRTIVAERPLVPHGAFDLGVLGLATAITREASASISSPTGGGERLAVDWRFWAHRPLYQLSLAAPAPWRGVWKVSASRERQPYTTAFVATEHDGVQLAVADWASRGARWEVGAGVDRWNHGTSFMTTTGAVRLVTAADRLNTRAQFRTWFGGGSAFQQGQVRVTARSSTRLNGVVLVVDGGIAAVGPQAPADLWFAGDTGRARPLLLRAHPILTEGERFRTERMARVFAHESTELQRWWAPGPFRAGVAGFVDTARAARRLSGAAITDIDVGFGLRAAYPGRAGVIRLDVARGLRDGDDAFSVIYVQAIE